MHDVRAAATFTHLRLLFHTAGLRVRLARIVTTEALLLVRTIQPHEPHDGVV